MIREVDLTGDGLINYDEFLRIMNDTDSTATSKKPSEDTIPENE